MLDFHTHVLQDLKRTGRTENIADLCNSVGNIIINNRSTHRGPSRERMFKNCVNVISVHRQRDCWFLYIEK